MRQDSFKLAQGCEISLDSHKTFCNDNMLLVGSSGSGKTTILRENLMEPEGSYIISDPKGALYAKFANVFKKKGYQVETINLLAPETGSHYNPFIYATDERSISKVARILSGGIDTLNHHDPFWDMASELLLVSLIAFMNECYLPAERTMSTLLQLISACYKDEKCHSEMDDNMGYLAIKNRESYAVKQYRKIAGTPQKTMNCIVVTLEAKLGLLDCGPVAEMLSKDDVDFLSIGLKPTVVFLIISDTDRSLDRIGDMYFTQAINALTSYADLLPSGELPVPVMLILDDFAANMVITDYDKLMSTIRSRNMSATTIIQNYSQLISIYGEACARTIIANHDTIMYLGSLDIDTCRDISTRTNLPLQKVLSLPVEECFIFRRGMPYQRCRKYLPEATEKKKLPKSTQQKVSEKELIS